MSSSKSEKFKILALDGGGIRGVVTATILEEVRSEVGKPRARILRPNRWDVYRVNFGCWYSSGQGT